MDRPRTSVDSGRVLVGVGVEVGVLRREQKVLYIRLIVIVIHDETNYRQRDGSIFEVLSSVV